MTDLPTALGKLKAILLDLEEEDLRDAMRYLCRLFGTGGSSGQSAAEVAQREMAGRARAVKAQRASGRFAPAEHQRAAGHHTSGVTSGLPAESPAESPAEYQRAAGLSAGEGGKGGVLALNSPASKTRETQEKTGAVPSEGFETFYALYPRKRDCARTRRAWVKVSRDTSAHVILAGLRAQLPAMLERIAQGDMQFVPHPTTWLNGARWLPEVDPALVSSNGRKPLVSDAMRAALEPRP